MRIWRFFNDNIKINLYMEALIKIQSELNAPKNLYNSFGKYSYRSAESILEAVKPLLKETGCQLTLSDDIIFIQDRFYVKATASLYDGKETVSVSAFAREDESKKGMDGAQLTGATSSYARKYALNGLFCIDDAKDQDTDEYTRQQQKEAPREKMPDVARAKNSDILTPALKAIASANDKASLMEVWNRYAELHKDPTFTRHMSARKKEVL